MGKLKEGNQVENNWAENVVFFYFSGLPRSEICEEKSLLGKDLIFECTTIVDYANHSTMELLCEEDQEEINIAYTTKFLHCLHV